jgi:undecaprenyl-diphosphatase
MNLDTQLFFFLNSFAGQSRLTDGIIVFFANDLAYILVALFLIIVWFSAYSNRKKIEWLLVTGISSLVARFGVTEIIRYFYHRPRPFITLHVHQLISETSWSFPSGHATFFFAMSTAIFLYNKKWGSFFIVATILMTVSRVIAGVHYPSDIVGGAIIGALVAYATYAVVNKMMNPTR